MIILFVHRNFPAQFKNVAIELAKDPNNLVLFLTTNTTSQLPNVHKIIYRPESEAVLSHPHMAIYQESVMHGQAAAQMAIEIKKRGVIPDLIYGHSWGSSMFMKDVFPDVPYLAYFEWFSKDKNSSYDFVQKDLSVDQKVRIKLNNTQILMDLCSCDGGLSPTKWQKNQFPKEFADKINVIHDGVDVDYFKPDVNAEFVVEGKNLNLTSDDEVITYATRGMEALRGFPQFMEAVSILQKKRPNAHFVIAGEDKVFYGPTSPKGTFKEYALNSFDIDESRVHFVGTLDYEKYLKLLQISSAHVYLTYPFVLSWSILDAMACGCKVVGSNTQPVQEVLNDGENGLLVDFFDVNELCKKIEYLLDNPDKADEIGKNARKSVVENYDQKDLVPMHVEFIKSFLNK